MTSQASKLRLLLAQIKHKQDVGSPLTEHESALLEQCLIEQYSKPREAVTFDADNTMHIKRTNDAEPVLQAMRDYADVLDKHKTGAAGAKLIGSLDPVTASIFAKECGAAIGTKEFAAYAVQKMNDSDYKRFRVGGM